MTDKSKLILIKTIHTLVWVFFNIVIFYMLYAVLTNKLDIWLWIGYGLFVLEGITLLLFKFFLPINHYRPKVLELHQRKFRYLSSELACQIQQKDLHIDIGCDYHTYDLSTAEIDVKCNPYSQRLSSIAELTATLSTESNKLQDAFPFYNQQGETSCHHL